MQHNKQDSCSTLSYIEGAVVAGTTYYHTRTTHAHVALSVESRGLESRRPHGVVKPVDQCLSRLFAAGRVNPQPVWCFGRDALHPVLYKRNPHRAWPLHVLPRAEATKQQQPQK